MQCHHTTPLLKPPRLRRQALGLGIRSAYRRGGQEMLRRSIRLAGGTGMFQRLTHRIHTQTQFYTWTQARTRYGADILNKMMENGFVFLKKNWSVVALRLCLSKFPSFPSRSIRILCFSLFAIFSRFFFAFCYWRDFLSIYRESLRYENPRDSKQVQKIEIDVGLDRKSNFRNLFSGRF